MLNVVVGCIISYKLIVYIYVKRGVTFSIIRSLLIEPALDVKIILWLRNFKINIIIVCMKPIRTVWFPIIRIIRYYPRVILTNR